MEDWNKWDIYSSDIMLPMPKIVGWTRNYSFISGWLDAYVEAVDLGINNFVMEKEHGIYRKPKNRW